MATRNDVYTYNSDISVIPEIRTYPTDPTNLAIQLHTLVDGFVEPYATLTVNLGSDIGNDTIMPRNCAFIDINNLPDAEDFIKQYDIGKPYTRFGEAVTMRSGFVEYPLYEFNEAKLAEMDAGGWDIHCAKYAQAFSQLLADKYPDLNIQTVKPPAREQKDPATINEDTHIQQSAHTQAHSKSKKQSK